MDKKMVVIGVGNCGSQVANLAEKKYSEIFDTVYINSSDADLSQVSVNSDLKFKIGDHEDVEGSGKNRTKMKEYLKEDIKKLLKNESFTDAINEKKYGFIIASTAGGTGSGAAPVMMDILSKMFPETKFILVFVLPRISASLMEQGNTLEFLNELYDVLDTNTTYMVYDNESTSELSPTQALIKVNENIVEDIRILSGIDNYPTPYESIDEADMESIIRTPGRLLVTRINKDITEKYMEDNKLDDVIIKAIKQSSHAEMDRNKKVDRWGIITFFTEAVNELYSSDLEVLQNFVGIPFERFNHNAINKGKESLNFMYFIASGMTPINDRVQKVVERIEELKESQATTEVNKFILSGDGSSYNDIMERRKKEQQSHADENVNTDAIFSKFL